VGFDSALDVGEAAGAEDDDLHFLSLNRQLFFNFFGQEHFH
jgi:hypothetical protein